MVSELSLNFPSEIKTTILLYERKVSYPFRAKLLNLGVPISLNFFLRGFSFLLRLLKFKRVLIKEKPDYVVSFGNSANMMNIFANKNAIVRVDMHPTRGNKGFWGFLYRVFMRLFFNPAKKIISVSKVAADDLVQNYGVPSSKIQVIHNPIDIHKIQRLARESLPKEYKEAFLHPVVVPWYFLLFFIGGGILRSFKHNRAALPLLIFAVGIFSILAIFMSNFGIIMRIRIPAFLALLAFTPFYFQAKERDNIPNEASDSYPKKTNT